VRCPPQVIWARPAGKLNAGLAAAGRAILSSTVACELPPVALSRVPVVHITILVHLVFVLLVLVVRPFIVLLVVVIALGLFVVIGIAVHACDLLVQPIQNLFCLCISRKPFRVTSQRGFQLRDSALNARRLLQGRNDRTGLNKADEASFYQLSAWKAVATTLEKR
jgi:hypothetical protein